MQIISMSLGRFRANAYIIRCLASNECMLIDAPAEAGALKHALEGMRLKYIALTHGHHDHTGALIDLKSSYNVPLAIHHDDASLIPLEASMYLDDGHVITIGQILIRVIHTPGHTSGSVCFHTGNHLIDGDTLFPGGPGRTYSPAGLKQIINSITTRIFSLPDDTLVHPGHGESTTVAKARAEYEIFESRTHPAELYGNVHWLTS